MSFFLLLVSLSMRTKIAINSFGRRDFTIHSYTYRLTASNWKNRTPFEFFEPTKPTMMTQRAGDSTTAHIYVILFFHHKISYHLEHARRCRRCGRAACYCSFIRWVCAPHNARHFSSEISPHLMYKLSRWESIADERYRVPNQVRNGEIVDFSIPFSEVLRR